MIQSVRFRSRKLPVRMRILILINLLTLDLNKRLPVGLSNDPSSREIARSPPLSPLLALVRPLPILPRRRLVPCFSAVKSF